MFDGGLPFCREGESTFKKDFKDERDTDETWTDNRQARERSYGERKWRSVLVKRKGKEKKNESF